MRFLRQLLPFSITRPTYWSCTRFARWVQTTFGGFEKPRAATHEDWKTWKAVNRAQHRFVFWFTEDFLDSVQNFVMFPLDVWNAIRAYIRNRFFDKTHCLNTKLKPGFYYELDTRILHGLFEELVDFIECEKAWMHVAFDEDAKHKYNYPKWTFVRMLRFDSYRCVQAGLDHLAWEMSLKHDEYISTDDPLYGQPTPQAVMAKEQLELYNWWKHARPARPDPYDTTQHLDRPARWDEMHLLEEQYEKEDEEMLIRLIKIRRSLWT
jgi:hypothetical protein